MGHLLVSALTAEELQLQNLSTGGEHFSGSFSKRTLKIAFEHLFGSILSYYLMMVAFEVQPDLGPNQ